MRSRIKVAPGEYPEPDTTLRDTAREAGEPAPLLWQKRTPEHTCCAWLSCYRIGDGGIIVQTYHSGDWYAFTATRTLGYKESVRHFLTRCGVQFAAKP